MATNNSINCGRPMEVACGGTGLATITTNNIMIGAGTSNVTTQAIAKGEVLSANGSGVPTVLATSTDGLVLTLDSAEATGLKWAAAGGGGSITFIDEQTGAADTSIDFTSNIDGTYDVYMFQMVNLTSSVDNVQLYMRTSPDGMSWDAGSTDYRVSQNFSAGGINQAQMSIATSVSNAAGESLSGFVFMYDPSETTYDKKFIGNCVFNQGDLNNIFQAISGSTRRDTGAVQGVRFLWSSGTMTGTIRLYGVANA